MTKNTKFQIIANKIAAEPGVPNEALLSERTLAQKLSVNRLTLRRALDELERRKIIYRLPRRGAFWGSGETGSRKRIVVVQSAGKNDLELDWLGCLATGCAEENWELVLHFSDNQMPEADLAIVDSSLSPGVVLQLSKKIPIIRIGGATEMPPDSIDQISFDFFDWGYRAARYLLGHYGRKIGMVCAKDTPKELRNGVEAALVEGEVKFDPMMLRSAGTDSISNGITQLVSLKELGTFDAVIAFGFALPIGVLIALNENEPERYVPMIVPAFAESLRLDVYPIRVLEFNPNQAANRLIELIKSRLARPWRPAKHEKLKAAFHD